MTWRSDKERELRGEVASGVARAMVALSENHKRERIAGFSLVTNDSLSSLFHVATTEEANEEAVEGLTDDEDILAYEIWGIPTQWPYRDGEEALDGAHAIVAELYKNCYVDATSVPEQELAFAKHVFGTYLAIVLGLYDARSLFTPETILVVVSSDPGPRLQRLEAAAARYLNAPAVAERWLRAMDYAGLPAEDILEITED